MQLISVVVVMLLDYCKAFDFTLFAYKIRVNKANMKPIKRLKLADSFINGYEQLPPSNTYPICWLCGSLDTFYKQREKNVTYMLRNSLGKNPLPQFCKELWATGNWDN